MAEYIKRSDMRAVLERASINPRFADEPPAAEVAPVVHGRWIDAGGGYVACSECGEEHGLETYRASYCEDCGAKMDKEESQCLTTL